MAQPSPTLPDLPAWTDSPYPAECDDDGHLTRIAWTRDVEIHEEGQSIKISGGLCEKIVLDTLLRVPLVAIGNLVFTAEKAREIAASILEHIDLVEGSRAQSEAVSG